jgi:hypothetical protein
MATKATKPKTTEVAVVEPKKTAVALPAEWAAELAQAAKQVSAEETPSSGAISFRSGVMSYQGTPIPGNELECIVVGSATERALYDGPFDPNKIKSPVCFAIYKNDDDEGVGPHENSLHPQNETCAGCPMNEWGSAGEGRRGKACKELRRIAVIPSDKLESIEDIRTAEMAMAKVPVTSKQNWSNYVHKVAATLSMPYWAVMTKISVRPHIKNQFEVLFDLSDPITDVEALTALRDKVATVEPLLMTPYSRATEEDEQAPAPPPPPKAAIKKKF